MDKNNNIPVLDLNQRFLSYTNPAKARILLNTRKAHVFNKDPFMLQLNGEIGENEMARKSLKATRGNLITNFTKYFSEEREVFVQNMGNTQVSISFGDGSYNICLPKTRKPYNITEDIPFELLKGSIDFRRIVNRNPPILRLLSEEEYLDYYDGLAERNGTSFEEEFEKAQRIKMNLQNKVQMPSEALTRDLEDKLERKKDQLEKPVEINPQVVGFCAQADKIQGENRLSAGDFIENLESMALDLTVDDWEFVMSKGVWKTVKAFASKEMDRLTEDDEE